MADKVMTERDYGNVPAMAWIDIDLLKINEKYQRSTEGERSRANIKKIIAGFKWANFTPITVSKEESGFYNIIDGQHRYKAALALGDIRQLPCWVVEEEVNRQAETFIEVNKNRVAVNSYALYKAEIAKGDFWTVETEKFCNDCGIVIPFNGYCSQPNMTLALSVIRKHLKMHNGVYLAKAINIIRTAFPDRKNQLKADIINTLVDLKIEYGDRIKTDDFVSALRAFENVDKITAKARELKVLDVSLSARKAHKKVFVSKIKEIRRGQ